MALKNFFFRKKWVRSEVAGMKIAFFAIFDSPWTPILAQKGTNMEFLKKKKVFNPSERQNLYYYQVCDLKTD